MTQMPRDLPVEAGEYGLFDADANTESNKMFDTEEQAMSESEMLEAKREEEDPSLFVDDDSLDATGKFSSTRLAHTVHARVTFAATQRTTFLVNGRVVAFTSHFSQTKSITVSVQKGDVLGFQASGPKGWHGIIADIQIKKTHIVTGRHSFKSSTVEFARSQHIETIWSLRSTKVCNWKTPIIEKRPTGDTFSKLFPYVKSPAKYVWVPGQGAATAYILLRYVLGGDSCTKPSPSPSSTPSASPSPSSTPAQKLPTTGDRCDCIQVNDDPSGECFDFITGDGAWKKGDLQSCKRRTCYPKYECIENKQANSSQCIRRYATEEIQKVKERYGKFICKMVRLNPVKAFYTLYE